MEKNKQLQLQENIKNWSKNINLAKMSTNYLFASACNTISGNNTDIVNKLIAYFEEKLRNVQEEITDLNQEFTFLSPLPKMSAVQYIKTYPNISAELDLKSTNNDYFNEIDLEEVVNKILKETHDKGIISEQMAQKIMDDYKSVKHNNIQFLMTSTNSSYDGINISLKDIIDLAYTRYLANKIEFYYSEEFNKLIKFSNIEEKYKIAKQQIFSLELLGNQNNIFASYIGMLQEVITTNNKYIINLSKLENCKSLEKKYQQILSNPTGYIAQLLGFVSYDEKDITKEERAMFDKTYNQAEQLEEITRDVIIDTLNKNNINLDILEPIR